MGKSRFVGAHHFRCRFGQWMAAGWLCFATVDAHAFQTVTLAWDPNSDPVVGYKLYYGPTNTSGTFRHVLDLGNVTTVSLSNLLEGVTYNFAVSAYNAVALESGFSEPILYTVPGGENPTNALFKVLSLAPEENGGLRVTWESSRGLTYRVLSTPDLRQSKWIDRSGNIIATGTNTSWIDSAVSRSGSRFYVVEMVAVHSIKGPFSIKSISRASRGSGVTVTWNSRPGMSYRVLSKPTPWATNWTDQSGAIIATGTTASWTDPTASDASRFYIVEMLPP